LRVFIVTLGTRGDFELFWALGRALRAGGHDVVLGSSAFYADQSREAGLDWVQIGAGRREEMLSALRALASVRDRAQRTRRFASDWLRPQLESGKAQMAATAQGCDYFVSNLKLAMARGGEIIPGAFVTYDPPQALVDLAAYGSARHRGRTLELVAISRPLIDPDRAWGLEYSFTGFWDPLQGRARQASPALEAFVAEGGPPAVLTMGSMAMFDAPRVLRAFGQALRTAGRRGVVVAGWAEVAPDAQAECMVVEEADYDWLFARAACVVHHGGCGTLGAVLRAGVPSILLPQLTAQDGFGRALMRERLATGVFEAAELEPAALAAAIDRAVRDETVLASVRRWQQKVRQERGLSLAAELIEAHWRQVASGKETA
jgi:UDP:flavonoid glycosyltransferase YjiC (YdhE family)